MDLHISEGLCPYNESATQSHAVLFENILPRPLALQLDGGAAGCGGKIWPAGELLAKYAVAKYTEPLKVLDLGSGTGLVGLALALANPRVHMYLTDQEPMMPLMEENIAVNGLAGNVEAKILDWGASLPLWAENVDLVLAADCVYLEDAFEILLKTMLDLTSKGAPILLSYQKRRKANRKFFVQLKRHFDMAQIISDEIVQYNRQGTYLYTLTRINGGSLIS